MPDNCENCPLFPRVEALERANEQHSATHREMFGRLGALETLSAVQENKLDTILKKLDELSEKVDGLEAKPGKRWDSVVEKAILVVVGAIVGLALVHLGLSA